MQRQRTHNGAARDDPRRGVALVVVLGFLAVLTALAVGFAVTMRVERLSSNVYYHGARTRQFVHVGLARAIDAVDERILADGFYPAQTWYASEIGAGLPQPPLVSLQGGTPQDVDAYIPAAVFPPDGWINQGRWIDILDADNQRIGRYAWIAVNCSGLLDANTIAAEDDRVHGRDPGELRAHTDLLVEFANAGDVTSFRDAREDTWIRYESVAELAYAFPSPVPRAITDLFTYSLFPAGYYDESQSPPRAAQPFYIGGDGESIVDGEARIIAHFEGMGLSAENARMTWESLVDYVDDGIEPRNLNSFGAKPVPMLNEFAVLTRITHDGGLDPRVWTLHIGVQTELWYPFGGPPTEGVFTVRVDPQIDGDFNSPNALELTTTTAEWNASATTDGVFEVLPPGDNVWMTFTATAQTSADPGADPPVLIPDEPELNSLRLLFTVHAGGSSAGPTVDRLQTDPIDWDSHFATTAEIGQNRGTRWEVDDPRINWRWADWEAADVRTNDPAALQNNLGQINNRVTFADAGKDGTWHMYVRRGPMQVTGELGFLLFDEEQPWRTLPLTGGDALPVLDRFVVHEEPTRRGLVNINSEIEEALASVFVSAPIERWPSTSVSAAGEIDPDRRTITPAEARSLAEAIMNERPFTHLSDIGEVSIQTAMPGLNPLQLKSIVRNSANLLSPRQNLFTIVVAAQSMIGDEVMGEARALAVVWRDPYETESEPGGNLINRSFIRFFRWLDE